MKLNRYLGPLIRASLDNDLRTIRALSYKLIRTLRDEYPDVASEIAEALSYNESGMQATRSIGYSSSPQDIDSQMDLLEISEPIEIEKPIFDSELDTYLTSIIDERKNINKLVIAGLNPTSSLILHGEPGVGKTHLAKYLSGVFDLKFASLDMASAVSSYLGKTGQNLKKVIRYAHNEPTLLLLDEFDAIAKKRDDSSDLGELKRVVNVLLKELEDWPSHSVLIAATNHPELLDKAIWRRFDTTIQIPLPNIDVRKQIIERELGILSKNVPLDLIAELTDNISPADIVKICEKSKKAIILNNIDPTKSLVSEIARIINDPGIDFNIKFSLIARNNLNMTYREIATLLDKSVSSVQHYIKKGGNI